MSTFELRVRPEVVLKEAAPELVAALKALLAELDWCDERNESEAHSYCHKCAGGAMSGDKHNARCVATKLLERMEGH